MTVKEIKAEIKAVKAEMKERGIMKVSCFNGGLDSGTYRANARLFQLSVQLSDAVKLLETVWTNEAPQAEKPNFARIIKDATGNVREALMSLEMKLLAI